MTRTRTSLPTQRVPRRGSDGRDPSRDGVPFGPGAICFIILTCLASAAFSQTADLAPVVAKSLSRTADLPGEFQPFLMVSLHARVAGYVEKVLVDRGSAVKQGQLVAELRPPEWGPRLPKAKSGWPPPGGRRAGAGAQP